MVKEVSAISFQELKEDYIYQTNWGMMTCDEKTSFSHVPHVPTSHSVQQFGNAQAETEDAYNAHCLAQPILLWLENAKKC